MTLLYVQQPQLQLAAVRASEHPWLFIAFEVLHLLVLSNHLLAVSLCCKCHCAVSHEEVGRDAHLLCAQCMACLLDSVSSKQLTAVASALVPVDSPACLGRGSFDLDRFTAVNQQILMR